MLSNSGFSRTAWAPRTLDVWGSSCSAISGSHCLGPCGLEFDSSCVADIQDETHHWHLQDSGQQSKGELTELMSNYFTVNQANTLNLNSLPSSFSSYRSDLEGGPGRELGKFLQTRCANSIRSSCLRPFPLSWWLESVKSPPRLYFNGLPNLMSCCSVWVIPPL